MCSKCTFWEEYLRSNLRLFTAVELIKRHGCNKVVDAYRDKYFPIFDVIQYKTLQCNQRTLIFFFTTVCVIVCRDCHVNHVI